MSLKPTITDLILDLEDWKEAQLDTRYLIKAGVTGGQTAIGGTAITDILKLQGTSGNGTLTSPAIQALVGNNGATTALTILNNGNVGIGTAGPRVSLDITNNNKYQLMLQRSTSTAGEGALIRFSNSAISTIYSSYIGSVRTDSGKGNLVFGTNNGNPGADEIEERMRIVSSGNVGIGTTSPLSKLHIETGLDSTSGIRVKANSSTQTAHLTRWEDSSGNARLYVDGDGRLRGSISSAAYLPNQLVGLQGVDGDYSMTGMYDRNELSNAALRGVVTARITNGPGTITGGDDNRLFNSVEGSPYFTVSGGDSTTKMEIHIDLLKNQSNYWSANWHPFVHFRTLSIYAHFKKITVEVSPDNVTWYKPSGGEWETSDVASDVWVEGYWFGGNALPNYPTNIPGSTYRYVRFIFEEVRHMSSLNNVYISQIGLRHRSAPYLRQYALTSGTDFYGAVNLKAPGTTTDNISLNTNGNAYFNGNIGIGTTSPSALLHLKAGTATVAPFKLTAGTNLTTPENGALEYDGTDLFFTTGDTRYKVTLEAV